MATTDAEPMINGNATPIAPALDESTTSNASSGQKRKREDSENAMQVNGEASRAGSADAPVKKATSADVVEATAEASEQMKEVLRDILAVLRTHDPKPSILDATLPKEDSESSDEPSSKRAKLSDTKGTTIAARLENGQYADFDALIEDVEAVSDELLEPLKTKEISLPQTQYGRPTALTAQETRQWTDTVAFQKRLAGIVHAEKERQKLVKGGKRLLKKDSQDAMADDSAVKKEDEDEVAEYVEGKPVLTLFANAPGPKQLFTSFQKPKDGEVPPMRESGLPAFIGTTNIPPQAADEAKKSKKRTLGELFGPPNDKYKLQPPKQSKSKLVTTGSTVEFVQVDTPVRTTRRNSYNWFTDKVAVGQWLGYGGVDVPQEPTSPQAKRKQRDRALSTGEAFLQPTEGEKMMLRQAKTDALFRKVYGSFAPSYDDSAAIVHKDMRNEIWTQKLEEKMASKVVVIDPALMLEEEETSKEDREKELKDFEDLADKFDPKLLEWDAEEDRKEKEMDDILQEVSELLETLASFQRIRNSSLNTSAKTSIGQNNPVTDLMGTPSTPSSGEVEVYKTLKLQLAVLVNQLPPYAVARLNGDQLEKLNIKTSIITEDEDGRGVMGEDEATRAAKMQAYAAASGSQQSQLGRTSSGGNAAYQPATNQYNQTPRQQQPIRPSGGPQGYYTPQPAHSQARPTPAQLYQQRSSSGVQTYSAGYPTTQQNRSSYSQQYANQGGGARQSSYQATNSQFYSQMQNAGGANKANFSQNSGYSGMPGTPGLNRSSSGYQQTPTAGSGYQQQRPGGTATMYAGYSGQQGSPSAPRTATPAAYNPASQAQRPGQYSTPTAAGGAGGYYRPPQASASAGASTGQQYAGQGGATQNYQRLQQAGSASLTPSRAGSGTPQPPFGGQQGQQSNGTPAPTAMMTGQGGS